MSHTSKFWHTILSHYHAHPFCSNCRTLLSVTKIICQQSLNFKYNKSRLLHGGIHNTGAQATFPGTQNIEVHNNVMQTSLSAQKMCTKFIKNRDCNIMSHNISLSNQFSIILAQ